MQGRRARRAVKGRRGQAQRAARAAGPREAGLLPLLVGPVQVAGHDLQDLEALHVAAVEREEVEEVVGDDLSGRALG